MSSVAVPTYLRLAATGAGLLIAVGCGPTISSDRDSTIPIPAGATVEFDGGAVEGANQLSPAVANDIIHRRIQLAIMQQLQQKGYKIVDSSEVATFRVQYFVGVKHSTDYVTTTTGYAAPYYSPWGYGYGWGYGPGYGGWGGTAVTTTQPVTTTKCIICGGPGGREVRTHGMAGHLAGSTGSQSTDPGTGQHRDGQGLQDPAEGALS